MRTTAGRIRDLERRMATAERIEGVLADQLNQVAGLLAAIQRDSIDIGRGVVLLLEERTGRDA